MRHRHWCSAPIGLQNVGAMGRERIALSCGICAFHPAGTRPSPLYGRRSKRRCTEMLRSGSERLKARPVRTTVRWTLKHHRPRACEGRSRSCVCISSQMTNRCHARAGCSPTTAHVHQLLNYQMAGAVHSSGRLRRTLFHQMTSHYTPTMRSCTQQPEEA